MTPQKIALDPRNDGWEEQLNPELIAVPEPLLTFIRPNQLMVAEKVAMLHGITPPPLLEVLFDGSHYWLAKDLELLLAAKQSQQVTVQVQVSHGDARQAVLTFIKNAVQTQSYRRRYEKRFMQMLLSDPEWSQWSDQEIALLCNVPSHIVQSGRRLLVAD